MTCPVILFRMQVPIKVKGWGHCFAMKIWICLKRRGRVSKVSSDHGSAFGISHHKSRLTFCKFYVLLHRNPSFEHFPWSCTPSPPLIRPVSPALCAPSTVEGGTPSHPWNIRSILSFLKQIRFDHFERIGAIQAKSPTHPPLRLGPQMLSPRLLRPPPGGCLKTLQNRC